jgi:glucoamylase
MKAEAAGLLDWAAAQQRFCARAMLRAVSATTLVKHRPALRRMVRPARGSILASPAMAAYDPKPDYFFHWLRDSAIVADALREAIEDGTLEVSAMEHLVDFVDFSLTLCRQDGPTFLRDGRYPETVDASFAEHVRSHAEIAAIVGDRVMGEGRFDADGGLDVLKWGRPQNDGPALRALAVTRFFHLDDFRARAGAPAAALLRYDLNYLLAHWREPCCDLWEENIGFHYHTRLVQQAALEAGATFWAAAGEEEFARACAAAARDILGELDRHFDPEDGVYRGRLATAETNAPPRRLDIAVVLATIHAGRRAGTHSVVDPKTLATLFALETLFADAYPINHARPEECAPALGRYAGDSYFSGGAYYFSTLGAAQFYFLLAQAVAEGEGAAIDQEPYAPLAALRRGDMYLATVRRFIPASGEMSEQFSQIDGAPDSADDLAWSYACFVTACAARRRAVQAMGRMQARRF